MSSTTLIKAIDRLALSLMNAMVVVGLPLVALGLLAPSF
jgi:hypothetical protein